MSFITAFTNELLTSLPNNHDDNWDADREGKEPYSWRVQVVGYAKKLIYSMTGMAPLRKMPANVAGRMATRLPADKALVTLYEDLEDKESRDTLVKLMAFLVLGHRKVKLPINKHDYWRRRKQAKDACDFNACIPVNDGTLSLPIANLEALHFPIRAYLNPIGIQSLFIDGQYTLPENGLDITPGDTVLDCGGCMGDTALLFAHKAGDNGKVFSFEFMPENIHVWKQNVDMNPHLCQRIGLVQSPLWSVSGLNVSVHGQGPSAKIQIDESPLDVSGFKTLAIDDFVVQQKLARVDFIKMDIDGAELAALKGAEKVLRSFRPKLAISIYHKTSDFADIPAFLKKLDVGYRLHLRHYTIHREETILFAHCLGL